MAIQKSIPTPYGVDALYWRIIRLTADFTDQRAQMLVAGYLTQDARVGGASPLAVREFNTTFPETQEEVTRAQLYTYLMTLPEFEGGVSA